MLWHKPLGGQAEKPDGSGGRRLLLTSHGPPHLSLGMSPTSEWGRCLVVTHQIKGMNVWQPWPTETSGSFPFKISLNSKMIKAHRWAPSWDFKITHVPASPIPISPPSWSSSLAPGGVSILTAQWWWPPNPTFPGPEQLQACCWPHTSPCSWGR